MDITLILQGDFASLEGVLFLFGNFNQKQNQKQALRGEIYHEV